MLDVQNCWSCQKLYRYITRNKKWNLTGACCRRANCWQRTVCLKYMYRGADKSLTPPGRKQANVSVRMAWISFGALPCRKIKLVTARVSILLKSRASLTCFRACFLPGRVKDLSAHRYNVFATNVHTLSWIQKKTRIIVQKKGRAIWIQNTRKIHSLAYFSTLTPHSRINYGDGIS